MILVEYHPPIDKDFQHAVGQEGMHLQNRLDLRCFVAAVGAAESCPQFVC
jgi:hypothetical protein